MIIGRSPIVMSCIVLTLALCAIPLHAGAPTSQPAPDLSSPRATMESFLNAIGAEQHDTALACLWMADPGAAPLANAFTLLGVSQSVLHRAVALKLGDDAARQVSSGRFRTIDVPAMKVVVKGDRALVQGAKNVGFPMIRRDGRWYISPLDYAAQEKIAAEKLTFGFTHMAARHVDAARAVIQGRYQTVPEIKHFLHFGPTVEMPKE